MPQSQSHRHLDSRCECADVGCAASGQFWWVEEGLVPDLLHQPHLQRLPPKPKLYPHQHGVTSKEHIWNKERSKGILLSNFRYHSANLTLSSRSKLFLPCVSAARRWSKFLFWRNVHYHGLYLRVGWRHLFPLRFGKCVDITYCEVCVHWVVSLSDGHAKPESISITS